MHPSARDQARVDQVERIRLLVSRRETAEMTILARELEYRLQMVQRQLLDCQPADLGSLQGQAKAYNRLLLDIREFKEPVNG